MQIPNIKMNDHHDIPQLGFGLYLVKDDETPASVREARGSLHHN